MNFISIPTINDIYIQIDGKRLAIVEEYFSKSTREILNINVFGSDQPIRSINGNLSHHIELKRIHIQAENFSDNIDFFALSNFDIVVVKPTSSIVFSNCEWSSISESFDGRHSFLEKISAHSPSRLEV